MPPGCAVRRWARVGVWLGRGRGHRDRLDGRVASLQESGPFRITLLQDNFADADNTPLALAGEPLALDHGFPCRLIAPNRPGVLQTTWVTRLEVR